MSDRVQRKEGPLPNRLDRWLDRKIQGGWLKTLPRYYPLQGRGAQCPDQYARALLTGLRAAEGDPRAMERVKDDGRAFRSWAESVLPSAQPHGAEACAGFLTHGYAV